MLSANRETDSALRQELMKLFLFPFCKWKPVKPLSHFWGGWVGMAGGGDFFLRHLKLELWPLTSL